MQDTETLQSCTHLWNDIVFWMQCRWQVCFSKHFSYIYFNDPAHLRDRHIISSKIGHYFQKLAFCQTYTRLVVLSEPTILLNLHLLPLLFEFVYSRIPAVSLITL